MIDGLPARGARARQRGLALPPDRMPLVRYGRLLKRWRWVGVFTPRLMLCVGDARVGPVPQRWWAVARPDGTLQQGSRADGAIDIELDEDDGVEVISSAGSRGYVWTRKRAGSPRAGPCSASRSRVVPSWTTVPATTSGTRAGSGARASA